MLQVREDELNELDGMVDEYCQLPVAGGSENSHGKVNILLQTYISHARVDSFSLISDQAYVAQVPFPNSMLHNYSFLHNALVYDTLKC